MPNHTVDIDEEMARELERVRLQEGLASRDEAAEFLMRRRMRTGTADLTGRGRALYPIQGGHR
ncbi:hypothetical protein [Salinicola tamaricis]|uniref:hypothetical protein n=1 Tax=Salinicola tamaricis TaxID=1771309 RepID=UPI000D0A0F26|nr:hypothetical protein [Salinicola tamaricis]